MKRLVISDLDFVEENSKVQSISGAVGLTTPTLSTKLSTSLDTKMLTALGIDSTPSTINVLQVAIASGAGAAAGAASVGGRAIAFSLATA
jgi:hypothetical protein